LPPVRPALISGRATVGLERRAEHPIAETGKLAAISLELALEVPELAVTS
jgi:hypothetical protein